MISVMPINDTYEHIESTMCLCKPKIIIGKDMEEILVHNSFDGREKYENNN